MPKEWYLSTSSDDYLSGFENEEFTLNATSAFDEILNNSPESYDVLINDVSKKAIIQKGSVDDKRIILTRINEISCGDVVDYKSHKWLAIKFSDDNRMYQSTEIQLCNSTFPIETDKTSVLMRDENGEIVRDKQGRPIPIVTGGEVLQEPCVVETKYFFNNRNEQITLPEDRILITLKYQEATNIEINKEFNMYKSRFAIKFIDYSKAVNGVGVITITGERVMNK